MEIELNKAYRLLYPRRTILVTSISIDGKPNIMAAVWATPVSFNPPYLAICIGKTRYSHDLIKETMEFALNFPSAEMKDAVILCGSKSGKNTDKFKEAGLTQIKAKKIKVPLIKECLANIECKAVKEIDAGDHTIFVGEILSVQKNKKGKILLDKGGGDFIEL